LGLFFTGGGFGIGTAAAILMIAALLYLLFRKPVSKTKQKQLISVKEI
jgi:membrane-associated phospholipid phosphatase